jgi:hypothetical protein
MSSLRQIDHAGRLDSRLQAMEKDALQDPARKTHLGKKDPHE